MDNNQPTEEEKLELFQLNNPEVIEINLGDIGISLQSSLLSIEQLRDLAFETLNKFKNNKRGGTYLG